MHQKQNRFTLDGKDCWFVQMSDSNTDNIALPLVVMPVMENIDKLVSSILAELIPLIQNGSCTPFVLAGFVSCNPNKDLTPWPAPTVFKKGEDFQGCGGDTLNWIKDSFLPEVARQTPVLTGYGNTSIIGYSLGGLFSLWAFYETGLFSGCASCSGSLWYDGWEDYIAVHQAKQNSRVYLSLGDKEKKARNPHMEKVEDITRKAAAILEKDPNVVNTTLQWHTGGHFSDVPHRLAQGIAFLMQA